MSEFTGGDALFYPIASGSSGNAVFVRCGGVSFLAHPHLTKLDDEKLYEFLIELKGYGLCGLEGYYTDFTPEMQSKYQKMARDLGLIISGGTDFHAQMKPHISIGTGLGNMKIPYRVLENIKEKVKK